MSYTVSEISYPSSDLIHTVTGKLYVPAEPPRAILQISHGMVEHIERYEGLAEALTAQGILVAGNNHLGHGTTAANADELGFIASSHGVDFILRDLHSMNLLLKSRYPDVPVVLMGHSMGSFLARLFVEKYPADVCGVAIVGTGSAPSVLWLAKALVGITRTLRGERRRPALLTKLVFGSYNKRCAKDEGAGAWISTDRTVVEAKDKDPLANFTFTAAGYGDLFDALGRCNSRAWFDSYPENLPTFLAAGQEDPVGNYGKGVEQVYKNLLLHGCADVRMKLYSGARHEIHNDTCREEFFTDLTEFVDRITQ